MSIRTKAVQIMSVMKLVKSLLLSSTEVRSQHLEAH